MHQLDKNKRLDKIKMHGTAVEIVYHSYQTQNFETAKLQNLELEAPRIHTAFVKFTAVSQDRFYCRHNQQPVLLIVLSSLQLV